MQTLDLKKELKVFYTASAKKVELVDVPAFNFIRIDGSIEPDATPGTSLGFQQAMQALYGASYTLKFTLKKRAVDPLDYPVMALEGLWWIEDGHFEISQPGNWKYTVMILQPDLITPDLFEQAIQQLCRKKPNPAIPRLRLERFQEGLCMQTLHVGPYASEPETVSRMHAFAEANGCRQRGSHHEIYLGDPLRTDPSKLKTIIRLPVEKVGG